MHIDQSARLLISRLRDMYRIRVFEEEVHRLRLAGEIVGSVHLCNGQEAIYVGARTALDLGRDLVFPTYRGHGWTLACGASPEAVLAELLGRATGTNGGRGGSAYLSVPSVGLYGENSIVGAGAPIAAGAALAATFDGSGRVAVAAFGDGALNQGAVHEAMNFAAIRRLPVIFVVENNRYSELTPIHTMVADPELYKRAAAYGMPGVRVDGNDVVAVEQCMTEAVSRARGQGGPTLVEATTQRLAGHYIGDPQHYRPAGELDRAREDEPIARLTRYLSGIGVPPTVIAAVTAEVDAEIADASARALQAPLASPSTVLEHLYA